MKRVFLPIIISTAFSMAKPIDGEFIKVYEQWELPKGETLTISKIGVTFNFTPYWFGGINLYGATAGERGGFFTFGFESGLQTDPKKLLQLRSGVFVGAGGGGAAPQGGGLMLREFIETRVNLKYASIGAGVSHVEFPNGDISSSQGFVSLYIPFTIQKDESESYYLKDFLLKNKIYIKGGKYLVDSSAKTTKGEPLDDLTLIGIEAQGFFNEYLFTTFSLMGANGGNADGYMEVFGGFGVEKQIFNLPLYGSIIAELGMGGGGKVDTGGGSMYKVRGTLETKLFKNLRVGVEGGFAKSFKGTFEAKYVGVYFGFKSYFGDKSNNLDGYAIRALSKVHLSSKGDFKDPNKDEKIYLEGLAIDKYLNDNLYLTGQSLWAFKGESGGYTEGFLGVGYKTSLFNSLYFRGELLVGAAGGGGVKTGGLIGSFNSSIDYKINKNFSISIGGGYTKAKEGLSCADVSIALEYKFNIYSK